MRRLPLALAASLPLALGGTVSAQRETTITIEARGAATEFRTLGLGDFTVPDGTSQTFTVKPGSYTIVQAPPASSGLKIECSDGELHVHRVRTGNALRCTYTTQQIAQA